MTDYLNYLTLISRYIETRKFILNIDFHNLQTGEDYYIENGVSVRCR